MTHSENRRDGIFLNSKPTMMDTLTKDGQDTTTPTRKTLLLGGCIMVGITIQTPTTKERKKQYDQSNPH